MSVQLEPEDVAERAAKIPLPNSPFPSPAPQSIPLNENHGIYSPSVQALYIDDIREKEYSVPSQWLADVDALLIFAAFFSVIVTAFVVQSLGNLQEDFTETSSQLLHILVHQSLDQNATAILPPPFQVETSSVIVTSLWVASLILSSSGALLGILCKQRMRGGIKPDISSVVFTQELRTDASHAVFERWGVVGRVEMLLHIAVMLFFAGLVLYIRLINETVILLALAIVGVIGTTYIAAWIIPLVSDALSRTHKNSHVLRKAAAYMVYILAQKFLAIKSAILKPFRSTRQSLEIIISVVWEVANRQINSFDWVGASDVAFRQKHDTSVELLSWIVHSPLQSGDLEVSELMSGSEQKPLAETLGDPDTILQHMEFSCFVRQSNGTLKPIPEHIPLVMRCLAMWLDRVNTARTYYVTSTHPFLLSSPGQIVASLLRCTEGLDQLRVMVASLWWIRPEESGDCRELIKHRLMEYIYGLVELPDEIVGALTDDPHPPNGTFPLMVQLLQKYLDREVLPPLDCISAVLLNMCNSRSLVQFFYTTDTHPSLMIPILLDEVEDSRAVILKLTRSLWSLDPNMPGSSELGQSLFGLLYRKPPLSDKQLLDVLSTVSIAPDSCQIKEHGLRDLTHFYRKHGSAALAPGAISAVTASVESIVRVECAVSPTLERDLLHCADVVTDGILDFELRKEPIDKRIILPGVYTLSLIVKRLPSSILSTRIPTVLPQLIRAASILTGNHEIVVMRHVLCIVGAVARQGISISSEFIHSLSTWEELAIHSDVWIRWTSFGILKLLAHHLPHDERWRIFGAIADDVGERLQLPNLVPFVALDWRAIVDSTFARPPGMLTQDVEVHDVSSRLKLLLDGTPAAAVSDVCVHGTKNFPWLHPFNAWSREHFDP